MRATSSGGEMSNERTFRVALSREALKYYRKVSTNTAVKLDKCFANLESGPFHGSNIRLLRGMPEKYRYRAGNLRIVYEVDIPQKVVYVIAILPRSQAYKRSN